MVEFDTDNGCIEFCARGGYIHAPFSYYSVQVCFLATLIPILSGLFNFQLKYDDERSLLNFVK